MENQDLQEYLEQGVALAGQCKYEEAKAQFEKALKINADSGLAYFHLGCVDILQGNTAEGLENYDKALANGYDDAQIYYNIALLDESGGDSVSALRNYTKAIARDPSRPDLRIRKAHLLLEESQFPEALQLLDETIISDPDVFDGYHLKFTALLRLRQFTEAGELLDKAIGMFPGDPGFVFDRVSLFMKQRKTRDALAALADLENTEGIDDTVRRRICMERAQVYTAGNDVKAAVRALEAALPLSDNADGFDEEIVFLLTNTCLIANEYDKALAYARRMREKAVEPYSKKAARYYEPFALKMLGRTKESLQFYEEAIDEFRNMLLVTPRSLDTNLFCAMCLRDIEQFDQALEIVDRIIEVQPETSEAHLLRSTIIEARKESEEAAKKKKTSYKMRPEELLKN